MMTPDEMVAELLTRRTLVDAYMLNMKYQLEEFKLLKDHERIEANTYTIASIRYTLRFLEKIRDILSLRMELNVPYDKDLTQVIKEILAANKIATSTQTCPPPPFGCGKKWGEFKDTISAKEATISGLCQECQDRLEAEYKEMERKQNG